MFRPFPMGLSETSSKALWRQNILTLQKMWFLPDEYSRSRPYQTLHIRTGESKPWGE
jgi:hypothetical protein